jgi:hypothetical protein
VIGFSHKQDFSPEAALLQVAKKTCTKSRPPATLVGQLHALSKRDFTRKREAETCNKRDLTDRGDDWNDMLYKVPATSHVGRTAAGALQRDFATSFVYSELRMSTSRLWT